MTGELERKVDRIWADFWAGGIVDPLEVIPDVVLFGSSAPQSFSFRGSGRSCR